MILPRGCWRPHGDERLVTRAELLQYISRFDPNKLCGVSTEAGTGAAKNQSLLPLPNMA